MLDKVLVEDFVLIWRHRGFLEALRNVRAYVRRTIYYRSGIENFLRYYLDTDGKNTILWAIYKNLYSRQLEREIGEGIEIMSEDWDNLIILDAYRADYFKEYSQLKGEFSEVVSRGDHSHEFIKKNFKGRFWDTLVISANVWYEKSPFTDENTFFKLINPVSNRRSDHRLVSEVAIEQNQRHPDKRLIIHYMSPHSPFEGEIAENLVERPWRGMYHMFKSGVIEKEVLRESYRETIQIIEQEVETVLPYLQGRTVITSDHGENLGEKQHGMTLHSHGHPSKECRIVPWLVIDSDERKTVNDDEPEQDQVLSDIELNQRLEYLGYK